jgi:hypothetical protein
MVTRIRALVFMTFAAVLLVANASGAQSTVAERPVPIVHHAPIAVARAGQRLVVAADIEGPDLIRGAFVVFRTHDRPELRAVNLRRSPGETGYAAAIPASEMRAPYLDYTIEVELADGSTLAAFAHRDQLQRVAVADDYLDLRERALDERLEGRRSVASTTAEYVSFGRSEAFVQGAEVPDHYFRVEGAYTYRPLRAVTEFTVKLGVLRGTTVVEGIEDDVGINYTAPVIRLRLDDVVHVDLQGLTGVTHEGFKLGGGGELLIGDVYGSRLALGFEGIDGFGMRFWSRMDLAATRRLTVSPAIEATSWPDADRYGVRMSVRLGFDLGAGFGVAVSGGYQARMATSGGLGGGLSLSYAF